MLRVPACSGQKPSGRPPTRESPFLAVWRRCSPTLSCASALAVRSAARRKTPTTRSRNRKARMPEYTRLGADPGVIRTGAEVYVEVISAAVRRRLANGDDPNQAMLDALTLVESWLAATGEAGFEPSSVLVGH